MTFDLDTQKGHFDIQIQDLSAYYDLRIPLIENLTVAEARIRFDYRPQETGDNDNHEFAFPLQRLNIQHLDMEINTPWGISRISGHTEIKHTQSGFLQLSIQNDKEKLEIELDSTLRHITATISAPPDRDPALSLAFDQQQQHGTLETHFPVITHWLANSQILPDKLHALLTATNKLPAGIAPIRLQLNADSADHFEKLRGSLMLTQARSYLASADWRLETASRQLDIDAHMDLSAANLLRLIQPWLSTTLDDLQVLSGRVVGTLKLSLNGTRDHHGKVQLKAYELNLRKGPIQVEGAYLELKDEDLANQSIALSLDIPQIIIGKKLTLHNAAIKSRLQANEWFLEQARLPIFGGTIEILPTRLTIGRTPYELTLGLHHIELSPLLSTLDYPGLSGSGSLDGTLPLRLSLDTIEIRDGRLNGTRPGALSYQGPISDTENIAFKALRDLRYHSLEAKMNYQPDGNYQLGLRLEGHNTKVLAGHPLAFNLNIGGQLPPLLQEGLLNGDFERPILEQATGKTQPSLKK